MAEFERRDLQRLRYRQGQKLRSRDFNDLAQMEDQLRWWHNRALHDIPGVLSGFQVLVTDKNATDQSYVTVSDGLAYDGFGRELINPQKVYIPIPDSVDPAGLLLLAQLRQNSRGTDAGSGACLPFLGIPATRTLDFTWIQADRPGACEHGVVLGRLTILTAEQGFQFEHEYRSTRPLARPRIAGGSTLPGADWEPWGPKSGQNSQPIWLQIRIDTSTAGFTRPPCYFAWLQELNLMNDNDHCKKPLPVVRSEHIDEVSIQGFMFRCCLLDSLRQQPLEYIQTTKPYVCWIGIESRPEDQLIRRMNNGST